MKNLALVTGASSGIGKAIAKSFAGKEMDLVITGRREDRLQALKTELEVRYGVSVTALAFDVSNRVQCEQVFESHATTMEKLTILVNNAGLARGVESLPEAKMDDWDAMIDTNVKGLLYITRMALPKLIKKRISQPYC